MKHDLPKNGWEFWKCRESVDKLGVCDICGKQHLRWLYYVTHDKYTPIIVGSTCVSHITSSEDEREKLIRQFEDAKKYEKQKKTFINSKKWIQSKNLLYRDFKSLRYSDVKYRINIWTGQDGQYTLQIKSYAFGVDTKKNRRRAPKKYSDLTEIKSAAYDFIVSQKIEEYFDEQKQW